jgi:hypothetical protein
MWIRRVLICLVTLQMLVHPAFADVVVLRNGTKHEGLVSNREDVRSRPQAHDWVSILLTDTDEVVRVPVENVDYIVFEDNGAREVIDFSTLRGESQLNSRPEPHDYDVKRDAALALVIGGGVAVGVGAFVKFGGKKVTERNGTIDYDENSYNAANYAMIIGGVVLLLVGATMFGSGSPEPQYSRGPVFDCCADDGTGELRIGYAVRF